MNLYFTALNASVQQRYLSVLFMLAIILVWKPHFVSKVCPPDSTYSKQNHRTHRNAFGFNQVAKHMQIMLLIAFFFLTTFLRNTSPKNKTVIIYLCRPSASQKSSWIKYCLIFLNVQNMSICHLILE